MKILVDMDNTLNQFWTNFSIYYNKMYSRNKITKREEMLSYVLAENVDTEGMNISYNEIKHSILSIPKLWDTLTIFDENTIKVFNELNKENDVYICTTPWNEYVHCCSSKINWMKRYFPEFDINKIIFIRDKSMIKADLIIDDYPEKIGNMNRIIIDFPYNRHLKDGIRVNNWIEIPNVINSLKGI